MDFSLFVFLVKYNSIKQHRTVRLLCKKKQSLITNILFQILLLIGILTMRTEKLSEDHKKYVKVEKEEIKNVKRYFRPHLFNSHRSLNYKWISFYFTLLVEIVNSGFYHSCLCNVWS